MGKRVLMVELAVKREVKGLRCRAYITYELNAEERRDALRRLLNAVQATAHSWGTSIRSVLTEKEREDWVRHFGGAMVREGSQHLVDGKPVHPVDCTCDQCHLTKGLVDEKSSNPAETCENDTHQL